MNAQLNSTSNSMQENAAGSDSDSNPDDSPEYYQPISSTPDDDQNSDQNSDDDEECHESSNFHRLPNGYANCVENGISSLDLSDVDDEVEEEEEEIIAAADTAVRRAFREDESRRNSPLTEENATRVMEAMRRVSFGGVAPDWTSQVPEDQWIDHLRRLRTPPTTITSTN